MIRMIILLTVFLSSFFGFSQDTGIGTEGQFGGKTCDIQRGICVFQRQQGSNKSTTMKSFNTYKQSSHSMVIELEAANMSLDDQKRFFGKEYSKMTSNETLTFVQEEDFEFSLETLILLDLDINYKLLKKGTYPISMINGKVQVLLTLVRE